MKKVLLALCLFYVSSQVIAAITILPVHNHTKSNIDISVKCTGENKASYWEVNGKYGFEEVEDAQTDMSSKEEIARFNAARIKNNDKLDSKVLISNISLEGKISVESEGSHDAELTYVRTYVNEALADFNSTNQSHHIFWHSIEVALLKDGKYYDLSEMFKDFLVNLYLDGVMASNTKIMQVKYYTIGSKETDKLHVCFENACNIVSPK